LKHALTGDFRVFLFLGLSGVTLLYVFQFYSLRFLSATEGSVIINLHAVFAMLLSAMFLDEPLTTRKCAGVFAAFSGLLVITLGNASSTSLSLFEPVGVLLMVAAGFCWGAYSVFGKKVLRRYPNLVVTTCAFLLGTLFLIPFAISEGRLSTLINASWVAWVSVVFLAIPCSIVAYIIWNRLIHTVDVTKVLVSMYAIPIPTAIFSYLILGETFTYSLAVGAALVIFGVYLTGSSNR